MEIIVNARCLANVNGESIRLGDEDPQEFVLVGDHFQLRMSHSERLFLTSLLMAAMTESDQDEFEADDDWDNEDDLDKTYLADMIQHRLHENATAAMRELLKVACTREDRLVRPKKEAYTAVAVDAYAMAHAMQQAFEQTQGGFTEAPATSETEAAVAHRDDYVFAIPTKEGTRSILRSWIEEKKQEFPKLDVYNEIRKAISWLLARDEEAKIPNEAAAKEYIEKWLRHCNK
jgi:hypothetical protein